MPIGGPVLLPFVDALRYADFANFEWQRVAFLAGRTLALLSCIALFTVPISIIFAILLGGTDLIGRNHFSALIALCMAIPLPFFAVAWQGLSFAGWRPFDTGIFPARPVVHALAGLPSLVAILVVAVSTGNSAVVDNARIGAAWPRLIYVVIPRLRPGLVLAIIWLLSTVSSEIVITDLMQVRTFAEEVYTQFVSPATDAKSSAERALAQAVIASIPSIVVLLFVDLLAKPSTLDPNHRFGGMSALVSASGSSRQWISVIVFIGISGFVFVPVSSLLWRAGLALDGRMVGESVGQQHAFSDSRHGTNTH